MKRLLALLLGLFWALPAHATLTDVPPWAQSTWTSGAQTFAYTFKIYETGDLVVLRNGSVASYASSCGSLGEYTITGTTNGGLDPEVGGTVTMCGTLTSGDIITIYRDLARERTTDFRAGGALSAATLNDQLDRLAAYEQEMEYLKDTRILILPLADAALTNELPVAATRASRFLCFDASGNVTTCASSVAALDTLTDVVITGAAAGDVIYYNGTNWINLGPGSNGQYLTLTAGIPAWENIEASDITSGTLAHERGGLEADVSSFSGVPLIESGSTVNLKFNRTAVVAPTVNDDGTQGYRVGAVWIDLATNLSYRCTDNSVGAAIWVLEGGSSVLTGPASSTDNAVARWNGTSGTAVQNSGVLIDDNNRTTVGGTSTSHTVNGTAIPTMFSTQQDTATASGDIAALRHSDGATSAAQVALYRSRGTAAAKTVIQDDDRLAMLQGAGYDGTDYEVAGRIEIEVDGAPGANDMPGRVVVGTTADGATAPTDRIVVDSAGLIDFQNHTFSAADVNSGTLLHEQGGLEADVSAYNGLARISGGSTTNVTTFAELDTALTGTLPHEAGGLEADVSAYAGLVRIDSGSTTNITNVQGLNTALGSTLYSNGAQIRRTFFTTTSVTEGATVVNLQFPSTAIEGVNRRANEVVITEFTVTPTNPGAADVTDVDVTLLDKDTAGATIEQWNAWDPSGGALVDKGGVYYWDTDDTGELHITIVEQNGTTSYTYTVTIVGYILHTVNV